VSEEGGTAAAVAPAIPAGCHLARIEPAGVEIIVEPEETLFDAALREGYDWPTICVGQGTCTHCHIRLLCGESTVSPITTEYERRAIKRLAQRLYHNDPTGVRLACQVELCADITVEQATFNGERH
jgi:ferredoxin, 2Fe-2S